jgi:hypothetical protein
VTSEDSALTRFHRALKIGNGPAAYAAATELPRVDLADALRLTLLLVHQRQRFERLCVRWVGRFAVETRGVEFAGQAGVGVGQRIALRYRVARRGVD